MFYFCITQTAHAQFCNKRIYSAGLNTYPLIVKEPGEYDLRRLPFI